LREYAAGVDKAGLVLLSFPIIEMAAPTCIHQTHHVVQQTAQLMAEGHHIAVHCRYAHAHHHALSLGRSCLVMLALHLLQLHMGTAYKCTKPLWANPFGFEGLVALCLAARADMSSFQHNSSCHLQLLSGASLAMNAQVCELACRGGVGRAGLIAACLLLYTQQAATGQVSPDTHCFLIQPLAAAAVLLFPLQ